MIIVKEFNNVVLIKFVETEEERQGCLLLRQEIFIKEQNESILITDEYDTHVVICKDNESTIGTFRIINIFNTKYIIQYNLDKIFTKLNINEIIIIERAAIKKEYRNKFIDYKLFKYLIEYCIFNNIQVLLMICSPLYTDYYSKFGFKQYSLPVWYDGVGLGIPMLLNIGDKESSKIMSKLNFNTDYCINVNEINKLTIGNYATSK